MASPHVSLSAQHTQRLLGTPDATPTSQETPWQLLRIDLDEETVGRLKKTNEIDDNVEIKLGAKPVLNIGEQQVSLAMSKDKSTLETYSSTSSTRDLQYVGTISHHLVMQMAAQQLSKVDAANDRLEASITAETHRRNHSSENRSSPPIKKKIVSASVLRPNSRPDGSKAAARPRPSSPAINAAATTNRPRASSQLAPTSAPLAPPHATKTMTVAKRPFIHLLAVGPTTAATLSEKSGMTPYEVKVMLSKHGKESRDSGKWELADRAHADLDIWTFNYPSPEDRNAAQENARRAFDRMRVPSTNAMQWDKLVAPEDRGKGICLSKLKLGTPSKGLGVINGAKPLPDHRKILAGAGGEPGSRPKQQKSNLDRIISGKKPLKQAATPKPATHGTSSPSPEKNKAAKVAAVSSARKPEVKEFKSAELVTDDDDGDEEPLSQTASKPDPAVTLDGTTESGINTKKRKAMDDADDHKPPSKSGSSDTKRAKTTNAPSRSVAPAQSSSPAAPADRQKGVARSVPKSSTPKNTFTPKATSNEAKSKGLKDKPEPIKKLPAPQKDNQNSMATSSSPAASTTSSTPPIKPKSTPLTSHDKPSPSTLAECHRLQPLYYSAFRANLHLRLTIFLYPPDIRTPADEERCHAANMHATHLCNKIKHILRQLPPHDLDTLGYSTAEITRLSQQDEDFNKGRGVEPWILLPRQYRAIVCEVQGWREFAQAKVAALGKEYREGRVNVEKMDKESEAGMREIERLRTMLIIIRQVEAVLA